MIKLVLGAVFVAALAYAITLAVGAAAGAAVPFVPFAVVGVLALFVVVYAFAPGPL
jgi:hypothetical protein